MNIEDLLEKEKNEGTKEKIATTWIDATHVHVEIDVIGTIDDVRLDIIKALKEKNRRTRPHLRLPQGSRMIS